MRRFLPIRYSCVLEVGCAGGGFANNLSGYRELWGVEPDRDAAMRAEQSGYRVLNCLFDDALSFLPDAHFDLVVCNDVIEHLPDHDLFLDAIKKKMVSAGVLVGSVPNMRNYRSLFALMVRKDWPYMEQGILDRTHLRWFTKSSFRRALREHGFEIEEYRGIGSLFSNRSSVTAVAKSLAVALAIIGTLGYYRDIRHLEFAFRARWPGRVCSP